jgi:oligopeptide/dipeptide ABC transporter ATP-binding protein
MSDTRVAGSPAAPNEGAPGIVPAAPWLLDVRDLSVAFPARRGLVLAADRVSFTLEAGRTLGLVGESGCGKSVTLRSLLGLVPYPGEVIDGEVLWRGRDLRRASSAALTRIRGLEISMIFQDPMSCLNPVFSVGEQIEETLRLKLGLKPREARERAVDLLDRVGIPSPSARLRDFPHQLSGGMRQRVMIAIAIATRPALLLGDEPTTALDVTIQDQILSLLAEIRGETGMSMILVSHDVGVVAQNSDDVAVMYAGSIVERGPARAVLESPRHPYTRGLLGAIPGIEPRSAGERLVPIPGQPPSLSDLPGGCPFQPRCPSARAECAEVSMALDVPAPGHGSACPFVGGAAS